MSKFKIKKRSKGETHPLEINVTPMIDMFSVLIAFLLITAVFSSTAQHRVEIPFLSSAPPPTKQEIDKNPTKVVNLVLDNSVVTLEVSMSNNSKVIEKVDYKTDEAGLDGLQSKLYEIRTQNPKFDLVTIMQEPTTTYEILIKVLDAVRVLKGTRTPIPYPADDKVPQDIDPSSLIPKVILGNVIM